MKNVWKRNLVVLLIAVTALSTLFCSFFLKFDKAYAVIISQDEAQTENVDAMRYGYNVAAGKPLFDEGLVTKAPILEELDKGLYKHINKEENNNKTVAGNEIGYSAVEIAKKSASTLSGGVDANIKFVSMNIDAVFDRNSATSEKYSERYETYYQRINRVRYNIQDTVDLRDYLSSYFKTDLYNVSSESDALALFDKYGTHLFTGFQYGGMLQVTNYIRTANTTVDITKVESLNTKMNAALKGYGAGESFSITEQWESGESKTFGTSNYKVAMYGGESVTGVTIDQLFTYNSSYIDGKGNYIYDRWVNSINNGTRMSIIGTTENSKAIPLWDFLKDGGEYNNIKSYLIKAYATLCGDKYDEYIKKYPTVKKTIGGSKADVGIHGVTGYSVTYKDNTSYYELDGDTETVKVFFGSEISINSSDTIPAGQKAWKIGEGSQNAEVIDEISGIFKVKDLADDDGSFTIELYSGDECIYTLPFNVARANDVNFSGGTGTSEDPYLISTKGDFLDLIRESNFWGKNYKLTNNIDFGGEEISCIGKSTNPFTGVFDGNYCTISNFTINTPKDGVLALFAYNSGTIKNLNVSNEKVESVATNKDDTNTNKAVRYAGGLAGYNKGTLSNCKLNNVGINVKYYSSDNFDMIVGGLVGYSDGNKIERCAVDTINIKAICNNGTSTAPSSEFNTNCFVGGLIGQTNKCQIENSYVKTPELSAQAIGNVAKAYTGGFVGKTDNDDSGSTFKFCFVGDIVATKIIARKGGYDGSESERGTFVGKNSFATIDSCSAQEVTGVESGASSVTSVQKITLDSCGLSKEDWINGENGFPVLKTQKFVGLTINTDNAKREYYYGEEFNIAGVKVKGTFESGSMDVKEFVYDASKYNKNKIGSYYITIAAMGQSNTYKVSVRKIKVIGLEIKAVKNNYYVNAELTAYDFSVMYVLENGERINPTDETLDYVEYPAQEITIDKTVCVLGDNKVVVKCGDLSGEIIVKAEENEITALTVTQQPNKTTYYEGETFNPAGMEVTARFYDGSEKVLNQSELEIIGKKISVGENKLTIASENYVTCNLSVTGYAAVVKQYEVLFVDYDGSEIRRANYDYGETLIKPNNPVRKADNTFTYEFSGWDKEVAETVTESVTYRATYSAKYIDYTVVFKNYDGTVLSNKTYHYNDTIVFPANPQRPHDDNYKYVFIGWDNNAKYVTGNLEFTAVYRQEAYDGGNDSQGSDSSGSQGGGDNSGSQSGGNNGGSQGGENGGGSNEVTKTIDYTLVIIAAIAAVTLCLLVVIIRLTKRR